MSRLVPRSGPRLRARTGWLVLVTVLATMGAAKGAAAQTPDPLATVLPTIAASEPITPIPPPPAADPRKVALGKELFDDPHLSRNNKRACLSCHDTSTNGATDNKFDKAFDGSPLPFHTTTVFNAALDFRLGWEGRHRTLEEQAEASLDDPATMGTSIAQVLTKLRADPEMVRQFRAAYGRAPDRANLLNAIATYERSLLTPGSRFDRWLEGDESALSSEELHGYHLFKSLGCVSCHQGVNVGGNLFERHGIFHPLASTKPELVVVPSLRNVAVMAPYFQDGSAATLSDAVRKMAHAQLDRTLTDQQIKAIVAFLKTLTGNYNGAPLVAPSP
ncbi:MAG TPA: cytochrome c peroxidase [Acetobacteraceae bacterium]|nr:cytochrome c peroxidase [Acetobacteraceae bacterium]